MHFSLYVAPLTLSFSGMAAGPSGITRMMLCQKVQDFGFQTPDLKDRIINVYYELGGLGEYASVKDKMSCFLSHLREKLKKYKRTYSVFFEKETEWLSLII